MPKKTESDRPDRESRELVSAWLPPGFKQRIRKVQSKDEGYRSTLQDVVAEALNDLFQKYGISRVKL